MRRISAIIHGIKHGVAQLRRVSLRGRASVALLALLSLGLLEPLACILHCDVFLPLVAAQQHAHHQHGVTFATAVNDPILCVFGMSPTEMHTAAQTSAGVQLAGAHLTVAQLADTHMSDSAPNAPFSVVPAPFHEMALTLVVLLGAAWLLLRWRAAPPHAPPHRSDPPLLQPPALGF